MEAQAKVSIVVLITALIICSGTYAEPLTQCLLQCGSDIVSCAGKCSSREPSDMVQCITNCAQSNVVCVRKCTVNGVAQSPAYF